MFLGQDVMLYMLNQSNQLVEAMYACVPSQEFWFRICLSSWAKASPFGASPFPKQSASPFASAGVLKPNDCVRCSVVAVPSQIHFAFEGCFLLFALNRKHHQRNTIWSWRVNHFPLRINAAECIAFCLRYHR